MYFYHSLSDIVLVKCEKGECQITRNKVVEGPRFESKILTLRILITMNHLALNIGHMMSLTNSTSGKCLDLFSLLLS